MAGAWTGAGHLPFRMPSAKANTDVMNVGAR
jgi:hypothetical protein